jgi:hypothetical protein
MMIFTNRQIGNKLPLILQKPTDEVFLEKSVRTSMSVLNCCSRRTALQIRCLITYTFIRNLLVKAIPHKLMELRGQIIELSFLSAFMYGLMRLDDVHLGSDGLVYSILLIKKFFSRGMRPVSLEEFWPSSFGI